MKEDQIKEAFARVKQDMDNLKSELAYIKEILKTFLEEINTKKLHEISENSDPTHLLISSTHPNTPTHNPTVPQEIGGLIRPVLDTSIGNKGVPTDKPTDQQTVQQITQHIENSSNIESKILEATEILDSLDKLKKEIRLKFKKITNQEMTVFSMIYQLEEQDSSNVTYNQIALILKLSPSSIRDYVQRLMNKGIPIRKEKINNKKILLSISPELKKIASLLTIIKLREL